MKFKKIMLVTFVLLAILTIGAASAADDAASDDLAVEDIDEVSVDASQDDLAEDSGEVLASSDEETVVNEDGYDITIYNGTYDQENDEETHVVDITVPDDSEYQVIVTADGIDDEDIVEEYIEDLESENGIYYLTPYDFTWNDGTYDITVKILDEDDNELASQTGTITFNGMDPDDDDEDPYDVFIAEDFDVNDAEAVVASVFCPEESTGSFIFILYDNMGGYISNYTYNIDEDDWNEDIEVTPNDLGINEPGMYHICVFYNDVRLDEGDVEAVDYTAFLVYYVDSPLLYHQVSVLDVFCPDGSTGIVTVSVRNKDNEESHTSQKDVAGADDERMLHWTLDELNITSPGKFAIEVTHDDDEIDNFDMEVGTPFEISDVSYIGEEDSYGDLVIITLPSDIINATIIVSIDEEDEFSFTLDNFVFEGDFVNDSSKPIWRYLLDEEGVPVETIKQYIISNRNLEFDFEEDEYNVSVDLMIEGKDVISDAKEVQLITRSIIGNENVTIEIFKGKHDIDEEMYVVEIIKINDYSEGYILITVADTEWSKKVYLSEFGYSEIIFSDEFDEFEEGDYEITAAYYDENDVQVFNITATVSFYHGDDDDEEDDAEDGVVIRVADGDEYEFDLENEDDLNTPFAFVSVQNGLYGRIVIMVWADEEGEEQQQFGIDLEDVTNKENDPNNEGFTIYKLSLKDLENFNDLIECGSFKLAFIDDENDEIDSRNYNIEFDEGIVKFWESDDEEEIHGEGEYLEDVIFVNGNVITNDIIIYIPSNVSEIADDEFEVWNDGDTYNFKLSELESADGFYVIKVRDLFDIDEVGEGRGLDIFIQFYDDGEKAYYASPEDDEYGIEVYTSPFVNDEAYILENGFVVSFRGFEDVDDEFTVTISQEGAADIVKTFKISEIEAFVDDYTFYELHLTDLDITEPGNYTIAVNFTRDGEELAYNVGNIDVATVLVRAHGPDEDEDPVVRDVSTIVFHIGVSEDIAGFARLFVDGVQVGEDISFADLEFDDWPSHYGRQIYLNNYHITENGTYTFKVEVYDENGRFLADCENELQIEVGENSFEFISGPYGNEGGIEVVIRTPLEDGQYYNLYFNGELAGNYTAGSGLVISDKYLDQYFEMKIFKPGVYDVNVTFFDGENETDVTTGSFSVNELALTSDKTVYIIYEDHIMISFNADLLDDDSLRAYYVYGWDRVQRDDEMIFNPYGGEDMKNDGMYNDGIVSFDIAWTPDGHYAMEEGTTLIYVKYRHGEEEFGGFINVTVVEAPEPVDPNLNIDPVSDVEEGSDVTITISALDNFTGSVKVLVGTTEVGAAEVSAGSGTFTIGAGNFTVGENTVKVVSEASENFTAGSANVTFNVIEKVVPPTPEPVSPNLDIDPVSDVEEGSDVTITISALDNFTGSVKVLVGTTEVGAAEVTAGSGTFTIGAGNFTVGENTVKVVSEANENFTAGNANVTFTVTEKVVPPVGPIDPNLTISVDDIREGTDAVITITTNSTFSGEVKVQIGTDNYAVPVTNGTGSIPVSGLAVGNYTAVATFEATETFVASTKNATFKVNKAVVPDPETAISTDSTSSNPNLVYSINLGPDATGNFTVKVGDKEYTKELKGGAATIEVTDLPAGTYEAVISYSGDAKYAPISKTVNATVKAVTVIKATDVTTTYGTSKNIVITLTDANGKALAGKKVTVVLNGAKKELTTDAKGQVSYAVGANLAVKTYEVSFTFDGDANYTSSTGTAKVVVNKAKSKLTAKKKTFKAKKKSKKYTVTLKTDKGKALKKVKVTLTGKFKGKKIKITKKTNSKGKATFNLKKLTKKGKFKATVKFAGNKNYKASSKKVKITLK